MICKLIFLLLPLIINMHTLLRMYWTISCCLVPHPILIIQCSCIISIKFDPDSQSSEFNWPRHYRQLLEQCSLWSVSLGLAPLSMVIDSMYDIGRNLLGQIFGLVSLTTIYRVYTGISLPSQGQHQSLKNRLCPGTWSKSLSYLPESKYRVSEFQHPCWAIAQGYQRNGSGVVGYSSPRTLQNFAILLSPIPPTFFWMACASAFFFPRSIRYLFQGFWMLKTLI